MFGKRFGEYVSFAKVFLILIAVVGIARLVVSFAGAPDATAKWLSITVVGLAGYIYYGIAVHARGFGSYKQLLPLVVIQNVLAHTIVIVGIVLTAEGYRNIYGAPEYGGGEAPWKHVLGHVIGGMVIFSIVAWGVASLVMLITKKLAPRPALA